MEQIERGTVCKDIPGLKVLYVYERCNEIQRLAELMRLCQCILQFAFRFSPLIDFLFKHGVGNKRSLQSGNHFVPGSCQIGEFIRALLRQPIREISPPNRLQSRMQRPDSPGKQPAQIPV